VPISGHTVDFKAVAHARSLARAQRDRERARVKLDTAAGRRAGQGDASAKAEKAYDAAFRSWVASRKRVAALYARVRPTSA
jgi:hypothetical protein